MESEQELNIKPIVDQGVSKAMRATLIANIILLLIYAVLAFFIFKISMDDKKNGTCNSSTFIIVWGVLVVLNLISTLVMLYKTYTVYREIKQ